MIKLSYNLPDDFVERVRALEIKLDLVTQELTKTNLAIEEHRKETKRLRQVGKFINSWPGGAKTFIAILALIVFVNSLAVEVVLQTTNFHIKIKKQLIQFLEPDK